MAPGSFEYVVRHGDCTSACDHPRSATGSTSYYECHLNAGLLHSYKLPHLRWWAPPGLLPFLSLLISPCCSFAPFFCFSVLFLAASSLLSAPMPLFPSSVNK